jgi:hypothetical protein
LICLLTLFPSHGSLYFAADAFHGCTAAKITGDIGSDLKAYVESRFVVGPIAEKSFNDNGSQSDGVNRSIVGPIHPPNPLLSRLKTTS